jgi:F0F1-type ATP synthase assembly protein I
MAKQSGNSPVGRGFGAGYTIVGAGFQLVFSMLFFMGMGYLADRWLNSEPWLLLVGIAVGLAAGFYAFWLRIQAMSKGGDGGNVG